MNILKKAALHILQNLSIYLFVFLVIFTIDRHNRWQTTRDESLGPFVDDVAEYYAYLPDIFLGQDCTKPENPAGIINKDRRTLGMAILYSPFFFIGDRVASSTGNLRNGYTKPYQRWVHLGSLFYGLLGLWLCRKSLLFFFNDAVTFLTLLVVFLGTNLFFYVYGMGEMVHSYLFFLYSLFIFGWLKWLREKTGKFITLSGFCLGMICVTRPTDILLVIFVLYGVGSLSSAKERFRLLISRKIDLIPATFFFLVPLLLQVTWWKAHHGTFLYYSYGNERFFFDDPQISNFLFSFRKGWLVYSPLMLFSLIGMVLMWRRHKGFFWPVLVYFSLTVYVLSSWWDWSYGGSFGNRAMVQSYAVLIFPLAVCIERIWGLFEKKDFLKYTMRVILCVTIFVFIKLNLFQSWQFKFQIIHWSGMNKEVYQYVFLKEQLTEEEFKVFHSKLTPPDYGKMMRGERN